MRSIWPVVALAVLGCDKGKSEQTFPDGIALICSAANQIKDYDRVPPAQRGEVLSVWLDTRLRNRQARRVLDALATVNPGARSFELMQIATEEAGLDGCALAVAEASALPGEPAVARGRLEPIGDAPLIAIGRDAISLGGTPLLAVKGGAIDPAERTHGALGHRIEKLAAALAGLSRSGRVDIFVDRSTPFRLVYSVVSTAVRSGFEQPHLIVAGARGALGALPIALPDQSRPMALGADGATYERMEGGNVRQVVETLGLVVTVTNQRRLVLWSFEGQEGTLTEPKLDSPEVALDKLVAALSEIVNRRWGAGERPGESRRIIGMFDRELPFSVVASVMAAVRFSDGGKPLFPDVLLATGFE